MVEAARFSVVLQVEQQRRFSTDSIWSSCMWQPVAAAAQDTAEGAVVTAAVGHGAADEVETIVVDLLLITCR